MTATSSTDSTETGFPPVRTEPRPELIAPGSPTHRVLADPLLYVYGFSGFLLPLLHPATAAATGARDKVFTDDDADLLDFARRLRDTVEMIGAVALAGDEMDHVAFAMRELHRDIKGEDAQGHAYHAWTRDIWTWNWAAIVSALMRAYGNGRGYPSPQFRDDAYRGLVEVGRRFGVLGMPASYDEFRERWPHERDRVALADNATLQQVLTFIEPGGLPAPRALRRLPAPLWSALSAPVREILRVSILLGLDEREQDLLGYERRAVDELVVRAHATAWRVLLPAPASG